VRPLFHGCDQGTQGGIAGLSNVHVDLEQGTASFESSEQVDMKTITEQIEKAGYEVG